MAAFTSRFIGNDNAEWLMKAFVEIIWEDSDIPSEKCEWVFKSKIGSEIT
jgi:hypothetical protein